MDHDGRPERVLVTGFAVLLLTLALIVFSEHGYRATVGALKLFFEVVLPSLLPFFILSDVLLATGMVHFLGVFFEPLMRPLFNVPGVGSFVFSMGLAAGYPMDAVLTAKFRRQGLCTKVEAERLLAFTNSADPLFIFGAVAVGLFGHPELGVVLAAAHYAGGLLVGLTYRFYGRQGSGNPLAGQDPGSPRPGGILQRATAALVAARKEDGRPLTKVLNQAIEEAMGTLFMIMSYMVLVAVLLRVLEATGLLPALIRPLAGLFPLLGLSPHLVDGAVQGLFEIDLGAAATAHAAAPLLQRLVVVSAIIAWSGFSVHAQVASVLAGTDISLKPYFVARVLHALYAAGLTVVFLPLAGGELGATGLPAALARDWLTAAGVPAVTVDGLGFGVLSAGGVLALLAAGALAGGLVAARHRR
ncbi:Sporulation integral membrane protein YlbJ [Candidatus Hydrogenisulfobacillus filiaventi]|uniref:Sporulation integral membrane protein YlbJ n=1 Tax=Candidatus Hydrogenisulfobacillus filiaventi TaxID=2707344 RepID=A0A6F8ZJT5_9FIRM|nr:sporulation integral membrane protein YlbJ [Bacillota bacterium]CAB1130204.1 Sporulation integral membrane protein YlbJ [Candidatus Hydrogenisulfobacillus filiaventi]